jgi:MarR family transcriptional regulator, lower aerobic nicotinate degradation pathway regulator
MDSTTRTGRLVPPHRLWRLTSWLLGHASGRAYRLVMERAGGPQARTQYGFLAALEEFGPISQAELGRRLGVDRKDVVGVLNELERDGLAQRAPDDRDRRRNAITITPAGARHLRHLDVRLAEAHEALLEPLSARERQQLDALLQRLIAHHFGAPVPSADPRQ